MLLRACVGLALLSSSFAVNLRQREPATLSPDYVSKFESWMVEFSKTYKSEVEKEAALVAFVQNSAIIDRLNANPDDSAVYGHTQFSDMTTEQFKRTYIPMTMDAKVGKLGVQEIKVEAKDVPASFDWRDFNAVTPVKDQGPCGCCWADSAVQNVESVVYLAKGVNSTSGPEQLSVQQVVECDAHDYACYGGYPSGAFQYIIEQGGLASEVSYPFNVSGRVICLANQTFNETCGLGMCDDPPLTSYCDVTCSAPEHAFDAKISSFVALGDSEPDMAAFVAAHNPLSVALDARWLQFYKGGVADPKFCSSSDLDHAVLIVGYGVEGSTPYWTVKNSWGAKWGENGYFRLVRGKGKCGINTMVSTAVA